MQKVYSMEMPDEKTEHIVELFIKPNRISEERKMLLMNLIVINLYQ